MTLVRSASHLPLPHWDGSRILFEIAEDGEQIACAISRGALEEISKTRCFRTADLLRCFAGAGARIERLALAKLRARPDGITGRLSLWVDDVDDPPTGDDSAVAFPKSVRHRSA